MEIKRTENGSNPSELNEPVGISSFSLTLSLHRKCVSCIFHNQYAPIFINAAVHTARVTFRVSLELYLQECDPKHIFRIQIYFSAFTHVTRVIFLLSSERFQNGSKTQTLSL